MEGKRVLLDLFCGRYLRKVKFLRGADSFIKKFVASRAENPNHIRLPQTHLVAPGTPASKLRFVRYFKNSVLAASLAFIRDGRIFSSQTRHPIIGRTTPISFAVLAHLVRIPLMKSLPASLRSSSAAFFGAIPFVAVWPLNRKFLLAFLADSPSLQYGWLSEMASVGRFAHAGNGAIKSVSSPSLICSLAISTEQVHEWSIT